MTGMKNKIEKEILDSMSRDPGNWVGTFYVNRKDPRLIVPKMNPMLGWTFNFASFYSWLAIFAIILVIVLSSFFL